MPEPVTQIGPFRVDALLGTGATGSVYRALGPGGQAVAVKVPHAGREAQWQLEVNTLLRLSQRGVPGIVRILDVNASPQAWYSMSLVSGASLRELLRAPASPALSASYGRTEPVRAAADGRPPPAALAPPVSRPPDPRLDVPSLLRAIASVAATLSHLHVTGFAHGDLKPENIVLGADRVPVLIDFGAAALSMGEDLRESAVLAPEPWMTAGYVAPEVARGEPATPRSDLFALGCLLFECLTGALPARAGAPRLDWPPCTSALASAELRLLVEALLQAEPSERTCFAADVAELLLQELESGGLAGPPLPLPRPLHRPRHVGRAAELAALQRAVASSAGAAGGLIVVEGEGGAGKTRLLGELLRQSRGTEVRFVVATAEDAAPGSVQLEQPLRQALSGAAVTQPAPGFVAALLAGHVPGAGAASAGSPSPQQFYAELYRSALWLAETRPLVLVVDDLQLASDGTRALLAALLQGAMRNILAIVSCDRAALDAPLQELVGRCRERILLPRMAEDEARLLLRDALATQSVPVGLARAIYERSAGNPRYALEFAQAALQTGLLCRVGRGWVVRDTGQEPGATLPASLDQLFLQRCQGLSRAAQHLLQLLTLLGGKPAAATALGLAQHIFCLAPADVDAALEELLQSGIVRQTPGARWELEHPVLADFVRSHLPVQELRRLHRLVASWLEQGAEPGEQLGLHWLEAGEHERAVPFLIRAGQSQRARHQLRLAERSLAQALDCIDALGGDGPAEQRPEQRSPRGAAEWRDRALEVCEALADVRAQLGWSKEAVQALRRLVDGAPRPLQRARALRRWGALCMATNEYEAAEQKFLAALAELSTASAGAEQQAEQNDIQLYRIENCYYQHDTRGMRAIVEQQRTVLQAGSALQRGKLALCVANLLFQEAGFSYTPAAGEEWLRAISLIGHGSAEQAMAAMAQVDLGMALLFGGPAEWQASSLHLTAGVAAADRASDLKLLARGRAYLSTALRRLQHIAEVEREARLCIDVAESCQLRAYVAVGWGNLSWTALMRGDDAHAVTLAERALGLWRELEAPYPMQWIAAFPLLAALSSGPPGALAQPLQILLDPRQQPLPEELARHLERALHSHGSTRAEAAQAALLSAHAARFL